MDKTAGSTSCFPDLSHLAHTIAELYQEGIAEVSAAGMGKWDPEVEREEQEKLGVVYIPETRLPCRTNPFDGSLVAFDRAASKLTILLSLGKPLRVVAELYGMDGRFIKRLFDMRMENGLTEIIGLGCRQRKGTFIVLLSSNEGMRSYRVRHSK